MSAIHVFRANTQPGHDFAVGDFGRVKWSKRTLVRCGHCRRLRWAGNCVVQAYYDGLYFWCVPGKGCRPPGDTK